MRGGRIWTTVAAAVAAACGPSTAPRGAAGAGTSSSGSVAVAIYPSTAIVREQRRVSLDRGSSQVRFEDMPSGLDTGSVRFESLTDPSGTRAVAQVVHAAPERDRELPEWAELTGDPARPLRMTGGRRVERHAEVPDGVTWTVRSDRGGEQEVAVSYQTRGLMWRADYAVVLDDGGGTADVNAWITIDNRSGRTFEAAQVTLFEKVEEEPKPEASAGPGPSNLYDGRGVTASYPAQPQYAPPSPATPHYRSYRYRRRVTLRDRAQRQLEWFDEPLRRVAATKLVVYDPIGWALDRDDAVPATARGYGAHGSETITAAVELPPVERELPPGSVRVYERAASGELALLGRATLERVGAGEPIRIRLGAVAGITGRRRQTDYRVDEHTHRIVEELEIVVTNRGDKPREVVVREHLYRGARFEIPFASAPYAADGPRAVRFTVSVPGGGSETVRYRVVYSWEEAPDGGKGGDANGDAGAGTAEGP